MIYYEANKDHLSTFLNLEEIIFLQTILGEQCSVKINDSLTGYFDLSYFNLVNGIPNIISCEMSDFLFLNKEDVQDIDGSEFISYRRGQKAKISFLNKFSKNDFLLKFENFNFYDCKYFTSNYELYDQSYKLASHYDLSKEFLNNYKNVQNLFEKMPLLCISPGKNLNDNSFPFKNFYYISEENQSFLEDYFKKNNIVGHNIKNILYNFHSSYQDVNFDLLMIAIKDLFLDLYGTFNNPLFGALCKFKMEEDNWYPKIIETCNFARVENFNFVTVNPHANFEFSKKDLNLSRESILNLIRFKKY